MREPRFVGYSPWVIIALLVIVLTFAAYAAPLVQIVRPVDKEIVTGTADIVVTYASPEAQNPIAKLELFIDGRSVKDFPLPKPQIQGQQTFRWDFTAATPSVHSISARAVDASGAVGLTGIKVMVQRREQPAVTPQEADRTPPTVDIYYPAEGQAVSGEIQVKADVSDNVGVRTVVFYLDGKFKTMIINSPNYADRIDTRKLAEGPHVVAATAWDAADNEGRSPERSFIVRNSEATTPASGEARVSTQAAPVPLQPVEQAAPEVAAPAGPAPDPATQVAGLPAPTGSSRVVSTDSPAGDPSARLSAPAGGLPAPAAPAPVGEAALAMLPSVASTAAVTEAVSHGSAPRSSAPAEAERMATKAPTAEGSGLVASLAPRPAGAAAGGTTPESPEAAPLTGEGRRLPPPAAAPRPSGEAGVRVASVKATEAPLPVPMASVDTPPKLGALDPERSIVLASPEPRGTYVPGPVGSPRQDMVAMLPRTPEAEAMSKTGRPGPLDITSMARFRDIKVVFDGRLLSLRTAPLVLDDVSTAPLREIFEHTDGVLYWFPVDKRVRAVNESVKLDLQIGRSTAQVNGDDEQLMLAPFIKNGRTMVPLEFIARTLDVTLAFNSETGELVISSNKF